MAPKQQKQKQAFKYRKEKSGFEKEVTFTQGTEPEARTFKGSKKLQHLEKKTDRVKCKTQKAKDLRIPRMIRGSCPSRPGQEGEAGFCQEGNWQSLCPPTLLSLHPEGFQGLGGYPLLYFKPRHESCDVWGSGFYRREQGSPSHREAPGGAVHRVACVPGRRAERM